MARDYDKESVDTENRKYSYGFDFDVMHPLMMRAFEPFFVDFADNESEVLELGSYKGDFTKLLEKRFKYIRCIEGSKKAATEARMKFPEVDIINSTFENTSLIIAPMDNIIMTHVLEHLDDPVAVMKIINDKWLRGRFIVACPNANAPSRQIAVKMGLIDHNTAVTADEKAHGHLRTYTLDTLEADARKAGLKVVHRGGIFFKALANFQLDRVIQSNIISKEYLEGCYQLGQQYPDLCSSIFLVCEKG